LRSSSIQECHATTDKASRGSAHAWPLRGQVASFVFIRRFQMPLGQHLPVEDANDQKAVLIELVEHDMTPLLGASVARTNVVARVAKEQWMFGDAMKTAVQRGEVAGRLILVPPVTSVDTDAVDVGLGALRETKAGHSQSASSRR